MEADFERYLKGLTENLSGAVAMVDKMMKQSIEEISEKDPAKAKEYMEMVKKAQVPQAIKDLTKKINDLK